MDVDYVFKALCDFMGCFSKSGFSYSSWESMKAACSRGEYRPLTGTGSFSWVPVSVVTAQYA